MCLFKFCWGLLNIHDICRGRCRHCPWSKYFHVEQFCSTWKFLHTLWGKRSTLKQFSPHAFFAGHVEQNCPMWQAIFLHIVCIVIIYSVLTQNPFYRDLRCFDAIYALLCGAKLNPKVLSVEQKWQISCMLLNVPYLLGPLVRVLFSTPHHLWSFSPGRLPCLPHPTHQASLSRFTKADSIQLQLHLSFLTPIPPFFGKYLRCTDAQMFWRTWNFLHQATSIRLRPALPTPPCSPSQFVKVHYIFLCFSFPRIFCMSNIHRP